MAAAQAVCVKGRGKYLAFADALLAVIDGGRPALDAGNPYAGVVGQVVAAVDGRNRGDA